jgi:hypothetical protein
MFERYNITDEADLRYAMGKVDERYRAEQKEVIQISRQGRSSLHFSLHSASKEKRLLSFGLEAVHSKRDIGRGGGDRNRIPNF